MFGENDQMKENRQIHRHHEVHIWRYKQELQPGAMSSSTDILPTAYGTSLKEQTAHSFWIFVHKYRNSSLTTGKRNSLSFHMSSGFTSSFTHGYLLCRLPEVSGVRQPAVQLGQLLQHVGQLGEGRPVPQVVRPAGGENLLRGQPWVSVPQWDWRMVLLLHHSCMAASPHAVLTCWTHRHFLAEADLRQHLLHALSTPHLPDGGFHGLVGDWPVPGLELIPNSA